MEFERKNIKSIRRTFVDEYFFSDKKLYSYYELCQWFLNKQIDENSLIASQIDFYLADRLSIEQLGVIRYKFGLEDGEFHSDIEIINKFNLSAQELNKMYMYAAAHLNNYVKLEAICIDSKIKLQTQQIEYLEREVEQRKNELEKLKKAKEGSDISQILLNEMTSKMHFSSKAIKALKKNKITSIIQFISLSDRQIAELNGVGNIICQELIEKRDGIKKILKN